MSSQKIVEAILAINPQAQFSCGGGNIDNIKWLNETAPISKADIAAKQAELQVAYDNNQYQRDRAAEYPAIEDQLDDIYHNGIDGWKATIKVTKDKYPK